MSKAYNNIVISLGSLLDIWLLLGLLLLQIKSSNKLANPFTKGLSREVESEFSRLGLKLFTTSHQ